MNNEMMVAHSVRMCEQDSDELSDLDGGDVLFPPNVDARLDHNDEIVPIPSGAKKRSI